jgi:prepilin-type N-terminal cleavage/methylation domain-containing protein
MSQPHGSKRAFSLIEMLVVIAIIGVLVAVLLPDLSQAKAKAHRVKCVAQLDIRSARSSSATRKIMKPDCHGN